MLTFATKYYLPVPNLNEPVLMNDWHLIRRQLLLREINRDPPLLSCKRGRSVKDILVRTK